MDCAAGAKASYPHYPVEVDPEFQSLIPPLTPEELDGLRRNIIEHGCRVPIDTWNGLIVDGHNRFSICAELNIPFKTLPIDFPDRESALVWIVDNQLGRRNLSAFVRGELVLKKKDVIAAQAKERQKIGGETAGRGRPMDKVPLISAEPIPASERETNHILAHEAGIGRDTLRKIEVILNKGTSEEINLVRIGEESINKIHGDIVFRDFQKQRIELIEKPEPEIKYSLKYNTAKDQIWRCGIHSVVCGNCYEYINANIKPDAIITDPPYGIGYKPDWNKWDGRKSDFKKIDGDDKQFDPAPFLNYPAVLLFGANYFCNKLPLGGWLCWDKRIKEDLDDMFGSPFELAWYKSSNTNTKSIMVRVQHGGVINADSEYGNNDKRYHPTQKPVAVLYKAIEKIAPNSRLILDPFAGVGSTLLACERLKIPSVSIEIDPEYVAIILHRYEKETGVIPCLG